MELNQSSRISRGNPLLEREDADGENPGTPAHVNGEEASASGAAEEGAPRIVAHGRFLG